MRSIARRGFMKLLAAAGIVSSAGCAPVEDDDSESAEGAATAGTEFDYIVIGSGAGGGPLACNLARAGFEVLLLEAGEDMKDVDNYEVPAFHTKSTEDEKMRWDYYVDHYADQTQARQDTKFVWKTTDGKKVALAQQPENPNAKIPEGSKPLGILYPRSAALGGCTAHNAMIMIAPHESDWQALYTLTRDPNFAPDVMRKYLAYLENAEYLTKTPPGVPPLSTNGHGTRGWLDINRPKWTLGIDDGKLLRILKAVGRTFARHTPGIQLPTLEVGKLFTKDLNAAGKGRDSTEGIFGVPLTTRADGHRAGPADYIRKTKALPQSKLRLETGVLVTKIELEKQADGKLKATRVHYRRGKSLYRADPRAPGANQPSKGASGQAASTSRGQGRDEPEPFRARREIIVACGAFNTPQLLKLSGIGPKAELSALGIKVAKDLPAVGTNLQDRYEVGIVSKSSKPFEITEPCTWGKPGDPCLVEWRTGKGVYTSNGAVAAVVKRSKAAEPIAVGPADCDLVIFGLPSFFKGYFDGYSDLVTRDANHFTWAVLKGHTRNAKGTVKLRSADPLDTPFIDFNYFAEGADEDLAAMVEGVRFVQDLNDETRDTFSTAGIFSVGEYTEVVPKLPTSSDDASKNRAISDFVRNEAWGHHASCTCPIGKDDDEATSVVNSKFLVHGTTNLRVVDASVFRKIPGLFIVSAIYMVSEKATDDILEAAKKDRRVGFATRA